MSAISRLLAIETGLPEPLLYKIAVSAPTRYKTYTIPKRNGGVRKISQPAREVKLLQRALIQILLRTLPVHDCATAYRDGLSIADNAARHAGTGPIVKMDLRDFFPSIRKGDWRQYCHDTGCLGNEEDVELTSSILFHKPKGSRILRLAIGAPSSPMVSNVMMYKFDQMVSESLSASRVIYTRYADDLTFSAPRTGFLNGVVRTVAAVIRTLKYPRLDINAEKTTYITRKYHRSVTGLTLTNDSRVTIGREKKREVHAAVHRASLTVLNPRELQILSGTLAFINAVEPEFLDVLRRRYGADTISVLQKSVYHSKWPNIG